MKDVLRLFLLAFVVIGYWLPVHGQRISAFLSLGATVSQIEGDELKGFDRWGMMGSVGAMARFDQNGRWLASLEAGYARRGAFNDSGDPYNIKLTLDYVDVPVMVHYRDPYGGMMIGLGLVYGRLVRQPHGEIAFDTGYFIPDTSDMSFLKNDLSIAADFRFKIWKGLFFGVRYQYSLLAVKREWNFTERFNSRADQIWHNDCYNSSVMIRLMWMFGGEDDDFSGKKRR